MTLSQKSLRSFQTRTFPLLKLARPWQTVKFKKFKQILIVGPEKSGTTFIAQVLSKMLDFTFIDESQKSYSLTSRAGSPLKCAWQNLYPNAAEFAACIEQAFSARERVIFQAPLITHLLQAFKLLPSVLVVFVARNCLDAWKSQNKHGETFGGWTCAVERKAGLQAYKSVEAFRPYFDERDMLCKIKQDVWLKYQEPKLRSFAATVLYESFETTALWVPAEKRRQWSPKQTKCSKTQRC